MHELRELRELRRTVLISGSGLEGRTVSGLKGHTVSGLEGHTVSALEGHTVSALEGHTVSLLEGRAGSVACQSVVPNMHVELLSCPCCKTKRVVLHGSALSTLMKMPRAPIYFFRWLSSCLPPSHDCSV